MNKKVISSILAGAMAISTLGVSAFATSNASAHTEFNVSVGLNQPKIQAKVPTAITAFINPYKAVVTMAAKDGGSVAAGFASGVASATYEIQNLDTAYGLGVTITPTIKGSKTVEVVEAPFDGKATQDKKVFAYLNTAVSETTATYFFMNTEYDENDEHQAKFTEDGETAANIMVLEKAVTSPATSKSFGGFRVEGCSTQQPETAWDTEKDTIALTVVMDLAPSAGKEKDMSLGALELKEGTTPTDVVDADEFDGNQKVYVLDPANYAATGNTIKLTSKTLMTSATSKDVDFKVFLNDKELGTSGNPATATVVNTTADSPATVTIAPAAANTYKDGDVLKVVLIQGDATRTYTFKFVAE